MNSKTTFSPNHTAYLAEKTFMCGLFHEKLNRLEIHYGHNLYYIRTDDKDIEWHTKPWFTLSYNLPEVTWKDDHHLSIFIKSQIKSGKITIYKDGKEFDYHNGKLSSEYPLEISLYYERGDK